MIDNKGPKKNKYVITDLDVCDHYKDIIVSGRLSLNASEGNVFPSCMDELVACLDIRASDCTASDIHLSRVDAQPDKQRFDFAYRINTSDEVNRMRIRLEFILKGKQIKNFCIRGAHEALAMNATQIVNNYRITLNNEYNISIEKFSPRSSYIISCIVPVYNGEKYIRDTIASVVTQTLDFFANIQLILVNDGSIDCSDHICKEFKERYPYNVTYIHSGFAGENKGVSAARNAGLDCAVGEYISFLDVDDLLAPDYFATALHYLSSGVEAIGVQSGKNGKITEQGAPDIAAFPINAFDS